MQKHGKNYKLKFDWGENSYEVDDICKQDISYTGKGYNVQVAYAVPEKNNEDYIFTNKEFIAPFMNNDNITPYTITYGNNGSLKHNGKEITGKSLCEALKDGVERLDKSKTDTVFVIKVNNNITNLLDVLVNELKGTNMSMQNEYMYFVVLDEGLSQIEKFNECKNNPKVKIINEGNNERNNIKLMEEISKYVHVNTTVTSESSIKEKCSLENHSITTNELNSSTIINLKLKEKTQNGNQDPTGENPGQDENQQHNQTTANNVANGEKIKGTIYIGNEKIEKPVYVKLTKYYNWTNPATGETEKRKSSMDGHTEAGKFGFDYISTSSGRTK